MTLSLKYIFEENKVFADTEHPKTIPPLGICYCNVDKKY